MSLGLYVAVPFCRSKCSFCNFASRVGSPDLYLDYCQLLAREMAMAAEADGLVGAQLDSIYWGGGTPTLLPPAGVALVAAAIERHFHIAPDCEHTIEAAPGTLGTGVLEAFLAAGMNRVSLGVQSFQDEEARSVGRLHRRQTVLDDVERLRGAGLTNLSLDLIAGLPHQSAASWGDSLDRAVATGVPHLSVYMLEVDDDSRLGAELLAGGVRYHAHHVPDDDFMADAYETACARLGAAGVEQYEISNFSRPGCASRHNQRYWSRGPYLGVGLDAHSLLPAPARRAANPDDLTAYGEALRQRRLPRVVEEPLSGLQVIEETWFLGLRRNQGLEMTELGRVADAVPGWWDWFAPRRRRLADEGLLESEGERLRLTPRGRLLSNRVFAEALGFMAAAPLVSQPG